MVPDPLNILKRKLEDESTPVTKRLCLAKNVVRTHHFPTIPKEKIIAEWLVAAVERDIIQDDELRDILGWINITDELSNEFKKILIQITAKYLQQKEINGDMIPHILSLLENDKMTFQLSNQITDFVGIVTSFLKHLKNQDDLNCLLLKRIFSNLENMYKTSKRKIEFISAILEGESIEIIFHFIDHPQFKEIAVNLCQSLLFPMNKKSFFALFLRTLLQKESIDELMEERGDNMQSVLKVMASFFTFPNKRTKADPKFLEKFIEVFVTSFKTENQLIFAFYIMVSSSLNFTQSYISPNMKMPPIKFEINDAKIKRHLFLRMLSYLIENEIDVSVKLTDTLGGSGSKVEIKKNFSKFIQNTMMGVLKLEGKLDKTSLEIITAAIKLDPNTIESKLTSILPPLMLAKKNNLNIQPYANMFNYLLETMFKLSKGITFVSQILPSVKILLEASNTEQFELQQNFNSETNEGSSKIITGSDLIPEECAEIYGKLTSELMYRQSKELLSLLHKEIDENCLMMLEEGFVSPSIITLAETLTAISCSFFVHNKMADHTVPQQIAEEFWLTFGSFGSEILKRLGKCVLKLNYNSRLCLAFLKLCISYAELKILKIQYGNASKAGQQIASEAEDLSDMLPFFNGKDWMKLSSKINDEKSKLLMINLLGLKIATQKIIGLDNNEPSQVHFHLIKELPNYIGSLNGNTQLLSVLFSNTDHKILKTGAKNIVKYVTSSSDLGIFGNPAIKANKLLLSSIAIEVLKVTTKLLENSSNNPSMTKALGRNDFELAIFIKKIDNFAQYFENFTVLNSDYESEFLLHLNVLKELNIYSLEENIQLIAIFVLLATKLNSKSKKIRKQIDCLLLSIFELSLKNPDLLKIFPIEYIFEFENNVLLNLLTLQIKSSNQHIVIKSLLEIAVKKVKTNSDIVKDVVKILLSHQKIKKEDRNINCFSDKTFQISCIILPIIAREKRLITTSNYRTILAELQEKLHKSLLKSFKSINLENEKSSFLNKSGNTEDIAVASENALATLNAMEAFSLTLSKYCESNDAEEIKNLDSLWNGLEFFAQNAINSLSVSETQNQHVESSIQFLNVILRHMKKLESHPILNSKDAFFKRILQSIKTRLLLTFEAKKDRQKRSVGEKILDDLSVTLKFLCELSSVKLFVENICLDLYNLLIPLKTDSKSIDSVHTTLIHHEVARFLWTSTLKANIIDQKCTAMSKSIYRTSRNLNSWIGQHWETIPFNEKLPSSRNSSHQLGIAERKLLNTEIRKNEFIEKSENTDDIFEILKMNTDILSEVILSAKKIPINYKFMDAIFELLHSLQSIMNCNPGEKGSKLTWQCFFKIFDGSMSILNTLIVAREALLEDRWPCYLQCYRGLVVKISEASSGHISLDKYIEERLAESAHAIEKLTQSISKRKTHISRLATYTIGDLCSIIERTSPNRMVRQHLENAVSVLLQIADTVHAMAYLKRALAGEPGQMTMAYLYTMYKRYHKYVGNA